MKPTVREIALIGLMVAVIEVCKLALGFLPNIELTTFWLILFTLFFGRRIVLVVPVFILIEGLIFGFGLWWVMYLYSWPLLVFLTWIFGGRESAGQKSGGQNSPRLESALPWAILSGAFGLCFGALCAIPYFFIGLSEEGGVAAGLRAAFTWWVAGIPWDIVHGVGNFVLMLILYHPVRRVMQRVWRYV